MLKKFKDWFHKKLDGKRFCFDKLGIVFFLHEGVLFLHNRKAAVKQYEETGESKHFITYLFRLYIPSPTKATFTVTDIDYKNQPVDRSSWIKPHGWASSQKIKAAIKACESGNRTLFVKSLTKK